MKYLLEISYEGTNYKGWQAQPNLKTIQSTLQEKMAILLKHEILLFVAGRTDAGVHAKQQFAHFETEINFEPEKFIYRLNALLKNESIMAQFIKKVEDDFHARYSCKMKEYEYIFSLKRDLFLNNNYWHIYKFDLALANDCTKYLIGLHDFSSFRDSHCQAKSPIRTIENIIFEQNEHIIKMKIQAQSFLHHQVRIIAGTIQEIVARNQPASIIREILEKKERTAAGMTAPARGLFLNQITF